jgi:hypothetical protein
VVAVLATKVVAMAVLADRNSSSGFPSSAAPRQDPELPPEKQQSHEGRSARVANPLECRNAGYNQPRDGGNQL